MERDSGRGGYVGYGCYGQDGGYRYDGGLRGPYGGAVGAPGGGGGGFDGGQGDPALALQRRLARHLADPAFTELVGRGGGGGLQGE